MTMQDTTTTIFCQNCGAPWSKSDTNERYYFKPRQTSSTPTSPSEITAAGVSMTFCPKCPIPDLDAAMLKGSDRTVPQDYAGDN